MFGWSDPNVKGLGFQRVLVSGGITWKLVQMANTISFECMQCQRQLVPLGVCCVASFPCFNIACIDICRGCRRLADMQQTMAGAR